MSREIDERIVEMRFDNRQFEAGVQTSLSTLNKLKKGLDLDGAAKGLDQLSSSAKKCDMSTLSHSVETVSAKFSALETIAVGALLKIGSQIATTGERLLKSMTIDQVTAGWSKYADKTTAVQTIMAATGKSIDEVNGSLEKLIWFTDETSYSMTDMTSNIGKFTSQGVDLETAVTAMEGISTWASLSGGSISEASRAMYNLSQALGVGAVKLQDWKSIENANMATKEFKEMAMEAAVATGDLTKSFNAAGNAIYRTSKGTEVTAANFSSTLSDAWFSSEALIGVLNNYGGYADGIYELYNNLADGVDKTTSEVIQDLKDLKGADDQTILNAGYTKDQIDLVRQLSEEVGGVGQKSFAAAQEAKTFSEVLDSVREAVGSGWAQTFETVFGNYEEAKVLWTDLANELYDVFAESGNARNELLSEALSVSGFDRFTTTVREAGIEMDVFEEKLGEVASNRGFSLEDIISEYGSLEKAVQNGAISADMLSEAVEQCSEGFSSFDLRRLHDSLNDVIDGIDELTGREHLISAFWNSWEGARTLLSTFSDAFRDIFPTTTAEQLYNLSKGLDELTTRFKSFLTESEEGQKLLSDLTNTFKGAFAVLDIVVQLISAFVRTITPANSAVGGLLSGVLGLTGSFGEWISNLDKVIKENDIFYKGMKSVIDFIKGSISAVKNFAAAIGEKMGLPSLDDAKASLRSFLETLKTNIGAPGLEFLHSLFERLCTRAKQVRDAIVGMKNGIVDSMDKVNGAISGNKFIQVLTTIGSLIKQVAGAIGGLLGKALDGLIGTMRNINFNNILDFLNALAAGGVIASLKKFLAPMNEMKDTFGNFIDWVKGIGGGVTKILDGVRGSLEAWQTKLKSDALGKIAASIAVLSVSLLVLSTIDSDKITGALVAITTLFVDLSASMAVLDKLNIDGKGANKTASAMIKMGAALLVLSLAMKNIGQLEPEQVAEGLIAIGVLLAEIDVFLNTAKFDKNASKSATGMILFAAAIKILASAVQSLGSMEWDDMAKGLVGVGALLAEVDIFLNTAKFSGKSVLTATGIVILASAIKILASSCKDFGSMSWGEIGKGLTSIAGLLLEIAAFTKLTGDAKHVISTGLALIEIAAAMKIFASAMGDFSSMSWEEIAKGLVAMGGALTEVAIAVNLMPKNMIGVGTGLVIVGAALKVVASALSSMGNMSWEEIAKGLVAMGGALAELSVALNLMNGTLTGSAALLVAAGALAVLTPVLAILGHMSWESIAKGLITIAGAFTVIGVAGAVLSPLAPSILALSAALTLLGVGSVAIGAGLTLIGAGLTSVSVGLVSLAGAFASSGTLIVGGLSAIVLGFAGLIPAIGEKIGEAIVAFCGVIANGAPAIGEAVKAIVLTLVDVLVECVPVIADGALQLATGVLTALATYTPQITDSLMQFLIEILEGIARNTPQLVQAAMNVIGAFFSGILSALSGIDTDNIIKGVTAVGLLTTLTAALGLVAGLIPAAMVGVVGMGGVITELAIVLAGVGALAQIPGLEWLVSEGGQFLQTIGSAIGGFIGSIAGGFMSGISDSFPQIGSDLSSFMTNAKPFIDGAAGIGPEMLTGVKALTEAIILITAADLLEGLTSWLTGGSSLSDFAEQLVPFGEAMMEFSNTIAGLDGDLVSTAAIAGKTLAEMAATLPNSGGVVGFFAGENDMGKFGEQLVGFGESMMNFADTIKGLDADAVQNAAIAGKAMAEMAATLPNTGGAVSFFTGNNDMDTFGDQLVPFGRAIKEYSDVVANLDSDAVVNSTTAGKALVELANTVPNTGGAVAFFTGDNDLASFADQIVIFGKAMKEYSQTVTGLDGDAVGNSATAGAILIELANTLPNTGGLFSFFTGDNDLGTFGEQIVSFGEAMKAYSDSITGIDTEAVTASTTAAQALAQLQTSLPNMGGLVSFFTGSNDLSTFAEGIIPFGEAMKSYGQSVSGINAEAITASAVAAQALSQLQSTLPNVGGVMEFFTGGNDLSKFSEGLVPFGEAMKLYSDSVVGIKTGAIIASATAAKSLAELQTVLPNVGGVMEFFAGGNDLGTFAAGIIPFGTAMKSYGEAVADINAEAITASAIAAQSLAQLQTTLPAVGGVMEFFTGGNDLATFAVGIVPFGEAMKSYGDAVAEINTDSITASAIAAQSLAELQNALPQIGGVMEFFTGTNDLAAFAASLIPFGEAMSSYGAAISEIDAEAVANSATAGKALVELANTLPKCGGLVEVFSGANSLAGFGDDIVQFGEDLAAYANAIKDVKPEVVTVSANAAQALSNLASGLPDSSLFDQWFGGDQSLSTFGKDISKFGEAMGEYYGEVSVIDIPKMNGVITAVWGLVDLAKGVKTIDKNAFSNFSSALTSLAGTSITKFVNEFYNCDGKITSAVVNMLNRVASSITANQHIPKNSMQVLVGSLVDIIKSKTADIGSATTSMMSVMSSKITSYTSSIKDTMIQVSDVMTDKFLASFTNSNSKTKKAVEGFINCVSTTLTNNQKNVTVVMKKLMTALIKCISDRKKDAKGATQTIMLGMNEAIEEGRGPLLAEVQNLLSAVILRLQEAQAAFKTAGILAGQGFVNGLKNTTNQVQQVSAGLAGTSLNAMRTELDCHSPSKETEIIGENAGKGLAIGLQNTKGTVVEASEEMATESMSVVEYYFSGPGCEDLGNAMTTSIANAIEDGTTNVVNATANMADKVFGATRQRLAQFSSWAESQRKAGTLSDEDELAALKQLRDTTFSLTMEERMDADRAAWGRWSDMQPILEALRTGEIGFHQNGKVLEDLTGVLAEINRRSMTKFTMDDLQYMIANLNNNAAFMPMSTLNTYGGSYETYAEDRQTVYDAIELQEEKLWQNRLKKIEQVRSAGEVSAVESLKLEIELYSRMLEAYRDNADKRKEIEETLSQKRIELKRAEYEHSMSWIEQEKNYNRLSLSDELAAYKRVQSRYAKGTDERKTMDLKVYQLEKEIYEAQKQYIADVQSVQTAANQKRADLEQEYADKVKSINEKLAQDIKSVNDQYENTLKSRENSLYSAYGLFDEVRKRDEVSGDTLMKNLENQVKEFGEWQDILAELSAKGLDSELIEELQNMGPSAISQIKALNSMTDSELEKYASLWSVKHGQAREQAVSELVTLRDETQKNIAELREKAGQELEEYRAVWQEKMDKVTSDANAELDKLRKDFGEKVGLIKKDTERETQEIVDTAQEILEKAGWEETGRQIVTGITGGVEAERMNFLNALTQMALDAVEAVQTAWDEHSPSRVFRKLGNFAGLGLVNGLTDYADKSYDAGANMADYATDGLSNAISNIPDLVNGEFDMQPTIRPVMDFSNVTQGVGELDSLFNNTRTFALAGQTSLAFNSTMKNDDMTITVDNGGVVEELRSLRGEMAEMTARLERMQIVLDTGTLVGELADPMDSALGQKQTYKGRGI